MTLPEIRQLRIFIALEETRSFTAAANLVYITQSAVSHSIKSLESQLGCELIERLGKKCILTPYGEVFLHHAKRAINELENSVLKIDTLKKWGYKSIRVGASDSILQYVLPQTMVEFCKDQPKCEVSITPGDTAKLLNELDDGNLDVAIGLETSNFDTDYHFEPIGQDKLCFITPLDHPWVDSPPSSAEEISKQRFITYGNETATNAILKDHLNELGIKQRAPLAMGNMESIKEMTKLGLGVGITSPWVAQPDLEDSQLYKHQIIPAPSRTWGYYIRRTKTLSLPEEKFLQTCKKHLSSIIAAELASSYASNTIRL